MEYDGNNCKSAVNRFNLVDEVYERLRKMITSGILKPGERLNKNQLCEIFQVSRAPLREAIQKLAAKGLVRKISQKGTYVVLLKGRDISDIFDLRENVETLAIKYSINNIPEKSLLDLKEYFTKEEKSYKKNSNYIKSSDYDERDMELHFELIINYSDSMMLKHIGSNLFDLAEITFHISSDPGTSILEHIEIVDALLARDGIKAEKTLKKHFSNMKKFVVSESVKSTK